MTDYNIQPENHVTSASNFEKLKIAISFIARLKFTASEYAIIMYQLDQQYNFIKNGEIKNGDYVGYGFMAKKNGISRIQTIRAVKSVIRGILLKEPGNKFGNHYKFNEHFYEWF